MDEAPLGLWKAHMLPNCCLCFMVLDYRLSKCLISCHIVVTRCCCSAYSLFWFKTFVTILTDAGPSSNIPLPSLVRYSWRQGSSSACTCCLFVPWFWCRLLSGTRNYSVFSTDQDVGLSTLASSWILCDAAGFKLHCCFAIASNENWGRCILDACSPLGECLGKRLLHWQPFRMPCWTKSIPRFAC